MRLSVFLRGSLLLLAGLTLNRAARAQTAAPPWTAALAITSTGGNEPVALSGLGVDAAGNSYVAGSFVRTLTLAPGVTLLPQGGDAYVAKYSPTGALLWVRQISGTGTQTVAQLRVEADGTVTLAGRYFGSLLVGGQFLLLGSAIGPTYLARLDAQGQVLLLTQASEIGAEVDDLGTDAAGNIFLSGHFYDQARFGALTLNDSFSQDQFLAKYTPQGTVLWARQGGSLPGPTANVANVLSVSATGECYLSWAIPPGARGFGSLPLPAPFGGLDILVVGFDAQGQPRWQQRYGTALDDLPGGGALDDAGHLLTTLNFAGAAGAGAATLGGTSLTGTGQQYGALVQLNAATGALGWARPFAASTRTTLGRLATDAAGNSYVAATLLGTTTTGLPLASTGPAADAVVLSYSSQGAPRWSQQSGGSQPEYAQHLALNGAGDLAVAGYFDTSARLGAVTLTSGVSTTPTVLSGFVAYLGTLPTAAAASRPRTLGLYPNPATSFVYLPALAPGTRVQFVDALGRVVREAPVAGAAAVSVGELTPGLYTLRATDAQGRPVVGKVIVE